MFLRRLQRPSTSALQQHVVLAIIRYVPWTLLSLFWHTAYQILDSSFSTRSVFDEWLFPPIVRQRRSNNIWMSPLARRVTIFPGSLCVTHLIMYSVGVLLIVGNTYSRYNMRLRYIRRASFPPILFSFSMTWLICKQHSLLLIKKAVHWCPCPTHFHQQVKDVATWWFSYPWRNPT